MIAREPFLTLESGGIIGAIVFALEGGGGVEAHFPLALLTLQSWPSVTLTREEVEE